MADKLQSQRFENKYVTDEQLAPPIRDFVRGYLVDDEFNNPELENSYRVNSLYIDNLSLDLCNATLQGKKNRYKLRIRFYDEKPGSPVFFEIKQRVNKIIQKQRAMVRRDVANDLLLTERFPVASDLVRPRDGRALGALRRFFDLKAAIGASGTVFVSYLREAYVSATSNDVRLTFDRAIVAKPFQGTINMPDVALAVDIGDVVRTNGRVRAGDLREPLVLELKFTDRFPNWMNDLVANFNLDLGSMPKYVGCVNEIHKHTLGSPIPLMNALRTEMI